MPSIDISTLLQNLTSSSGLTQLGALLAALLIAWFVSRLIHKRIPETRTPGFVKIGTGSAHRLVFPLLLLILVWVARLVLTKWLPVGLPAGQPVPVLNLAIPLTAAFAAIRLAVYLLRHSIPPSSLLKASERIIVYGVWLVFALHVTGLLADLASALDDIAFNVGKQKVTLLVILQAILSVIVTIMLALAVSGAIEKRLMRSETIDLSIRVVISKIVRAFALLLAVLIALPLVGIDLTLLSVFGGALGVGLGFGLQKIASNYFSGFIILLDQSIRIGDLVTVENRLGTVVTIRARYTIIRLVDGTEVIVPNDTLITSTVLNHAHKDIKVAVKASILIDFSADLNQAKSIVESIAKSQATVIAEPPPVVTVKSWTIQGLELELMVYTTENELGQSLLRSALLTGVWREFTAAGIVMPRFAPDIATVKQ
jgi:small-conductance mechanosensitive channel